MKNDKQWLQYCKALKVDPNDKSIIESDYYQRGFTDSKRYLQCKLIKKKPTSKSGLYLNILLLTITVINYTFKLISYLIKTVKM